MNFTPTSGKFWVTCNKHACKELIKRSKSIEGVVYAFMIEKKRKRSRRYYQVDWRK